MNSPITSVPSDNAIKQSSDSSDRKEKVQDEPKLGKPNATPRTITGKVLLASGEPAVEANVAVTSRHAEIDAVAITDHSGNFQLQVRIEEKVASSMRISASSRDGSLLGYCRAPQSEKAMAIDSIEIRLAFGIVAISIAQVEDFLDLGRKSANPCLFPRLWVVSVEACGFKMSANMVKEAVTS